MSERAPGFIKHPDYRVDVSSTDDHVRILCGDRCIADSRRPLKVVESRHQPVWYLPLADVDAAALEATDHTTYCPFKGHASYWSVTAGGARLENSIWGYLSPYQECERLEDHVGFYIDRFTLEVNGEKLSAPGPGWVE